MIGTVARLQVRPGAAEPFELAARRMVEEARAHEGCVFFGLFRADTPGHYVFMGRWMDAAAADAYSSPARVDREFSAFLDGAVRFETCPEM
jgi:quinol monooxygenase YgiN